jgi:hypothetical protein
VLGLAHNINAMYFAPDSKLILAGFELSLAADLAEEHDEGGQRRIGILHALHILIQYRCPHKGRHCSEERARSMAKGPA